MDGCLAHLSVVVSSTSLYSTSQRPSGWIGSVSKLQFSDLAKDLNQIWSLADPLKDIHCREATPVLFWLCASCCCPAERHPSLNQSGVLWRRFLYRLTVYCRIHLSHQSWLVSQFLTLTNISTARCCHQYASVKGWYGGTLALWLYDCSILGKLSDCGCSPVT